MTGLESKNAAPTLRESASTHDRVAPLGKRRARPTASTLARAIRRYEATRRTFEWLAKRYQDLGGPALEWESELACEIMVEAEQILVRILIALPSPHATTHEGRVYRAAEDPLEALDGPVLIVDGRPL